MILHTITKKITEALLPLVTGHGGRVARCADREAAVRWMLDSGAEAWHVGVSIAGGKPDGLPTEQRQGRMDVTIRVFVGLEPGAAADTDKRTDDLHIWFGLVWSWLARMRWGVGTIDGEGKGTFTPFSGFLDQNRPMLPGPFDFKRGSYRADNGPGQAPGPLKELLLASMEFTAAVQFSLTAGDEAVDTEYFIFLGN